MEEERNQEVPFDQKVQEIQSHINNRPACAYDLRSLKAKEKHNQTVFLDAENFNEKEWESFLDKKYQNCIVVFSGEPEGHVNMEYKSQGIYKQLVSELCRYYKTDFVRFHKEWGQVVVGKSRGFTFMAGNSLYDESFVRYYPYPVILITHNEAFFDLSDEEILATKKSINRRHQESGFKPHLSLKPKTPTRFYIYPKKQKKCPMKVLRDWHTQLMHKINRVTVG